MIFVKNLTVTLNKSSSFFKQIKVLDNISFAIKEGHTYGLIGRSGSGKKFVIESLLGLIKPNSGNIQIEKLSPKDYIKNNIIGYLPRIPCFPSHLTVVEVLELYSKITFCKFTNRTKLVDSVLEKAYLKHTKNIKIQDCSIGTIRRLGVAQAIIHSPKVLLLDEPMYSLDPIGRNHVLKILTELKQHGATILLCSHNLNDVQSLCDEIGILDQGRILKQGTIQKVMPNTIAGIELIINLPKGKKLKEIELLVSILDISQEQLTFFVPEIQNLAKVLYFMNENSIDVRSIKTIRQSLEDFFLRLVPEDDTDSE